MAYKLKVKKQKHVNTNLKKGGVAIINTRQSRLQAKEHYQEKRHISQ